MSSMENPCSSGNDAKQFLVTDWNSLVSVDQEVDINYSRSLSFYNVGETKSQGDDGLKQFPGSSPFKTMSAVNSFDILKSGQTACAVYPPDFYLTNKYEIEKNLKGKKRKKMPDSPHSQDMAQRKIPSPGCVKSLTEKDEKEQKSETSGGITHKPNAKIVNDCYQDDGASKEDYIHIRAKRGQATNSHSLAERVRREKISERMRLLQDLVPGCNKINGKAMMLDEIINYVQSLQRQVEFLSMKLAAVNPELQFDIEQILSKDILPSRDVNLAVFGYSLGMSTSHPHMQGSASHGIVQPEIMMYTAPSSADLMRPSIPHVSPMAQLQGVWDDELENCSLGFHA